MTSVILQNAFGQTIEIRRGGTEGVIHIRHTRIHPTDFGSYYEVAERVRYPPIARFMAKFGVDLSDLQPGEGGAYAVINRRLCLLDKTEVAMIREAIKQLE